MSSDPNAKVASARVPEVSDKYVNQPISWWWVFSYAFYLVVVLTLLVGGITWGAPIVLGKVNNFVNPPISHNAAVPTPTPIPGVQADCLKQIPPTTDKNPVLFFCSPRYLGNVAGPFGTHIILVGANFPSQPTGWFMPKQPVKDSDALKNCSSDNQTDCQSLPSLQPSDKKQVQPGTFLFSWVWQSPSFPSTTGNYFITAQVGNQFFTTGPRKFTLTTSQPPCITISAAVDNQAQTGETPDCPQNTVPFTVGASVNIKGKNWLLGWDQHSTDPLNMQVEVVASCIGVCERSQLFDRKVNGGDVASDGTFSLSAQSLDVTGKYAVMAWNEILVNGSPGGEKNTIVDDHALRFGENKTDLILNIT